MSQFKFEDFEERLSRLGDDLYEFVGKVMPDPAKSDGFRPAMDVYTDNNQLILLVDLPGMNRKQVRLSIRDRVITIDGERTPDRPEGAEVFKTERETGRFSRSFVLPDGVNSADIKASFKRGVLRVTIPADGTFSQSTDIEIE